MSDTGGPATGLKELRRLARRRSARLESGAFVIEGAQNLREALAADVEIRQVWVEPGADPGLVSMCRSRGLLVTELGAGRLDGMTATRTPQPVAAIASRPAGDLGDVLAAGPSLLLVLADVGDPGNVGTLVRVAEASGAGAVVCVGDTADPFSPKGVRASAGSLFAVQVVMEEDAVDVVGRLRASGIRCLGTSPHSTSDVDQVDLTPPTAFVLGAEARGLTAGLVATLDDVVRIPMIGRTESLNVAMAGSVLCYEALRQRRWQEAEPSS